MNLSAGREHLLGRFKLAALTLEREAFLQEKEHFLHHDLEDRLRRERSLAAFNLFKFLTQSKDPAGAELASQVAAYNRRLLAEHPAALDRNLQDAERRNLLTTAARFAEVGAIARAATLLPMAAALAPESNKPYTLARKILALAQNAGPAKAMSQGFEPVGVAFRGRVPLPSVAACSDLLVVGNRILCIGHGSSKLRTLNLEGCQESVRDLGLVEPNSLFLGLGAGEAWICDRGNARLVALGPDLTLTKAVHLPSLRGTDMAGWDPSWGGFFGNDLYLVCVHAHSLEVALFVLPAREDFTMARRLELAENVTPAQLVPVAQGFLTRNYGTNDIYILDPTTGNLSPSITIASKMPVSRFCLDGEHVYATAYGFFMKYGRDGKLAYALRAAEDRSPFGHLVCCAAAADGCRRLVFVLDHNRVCLHILRVDEGAWQERLGQPWTGKVNYAEQ